MKFSKVRDVKSPKRGTPLSAGIDFFVPNDFERIAIHPNEDILIPSGIKADIPTGYMLIGVDKSGVATSSQAKLRAGFSITSLTGEAKPAIIVGAKLVDEDYQGEIHIHIINVGTSPYIIEPGAKIAQFVLVPVLYDVLKEVPEKELFKKATKRGAGGFGSTGTK